AFGAEDQGRLEACAAALAYAHFFGSSSACGWGGSVFSGELISASTSRIPFLNSWIPLPMDLPISGMRFAPKSRMMIRKRMNISCGPMLNMVSGLPLRARLSGGLLGLVRLRPAPRVTTHDDRDVDQLLGAGLLDDVAGSQVLRDHLRRLGILSPVHHERRPVVRAVGVRDLQHVEAAVPEIRRQLRGQPRPS